MSRLMIVAAFMATWANCAWMGSADAGERQFGVFTPSKVPALLEFSAGAFEAFPDQENADRDRTADFQLDAISSWAIVNFWDHFVVNPYVGGFVTAKGGHMDYLGIHGTIPVVTHFELSPFFAIGAYGRGDGRDLGSTALFQAGLSALYVSDSGYRLGLTFAHESNGTILPRNRSGCTCNPGANNLLLTFGVPLEKLVQF